MSSIRTPVGALLKLIKNKHNNCENKHRFTTSLVISTFGRLLAAPARFSPAMLACGMLNTAALASRRENARFARN